MTGVGLDAFPLVFGQHRPAAFWQREWNVTPTKAHNEAVHVLATQGFPGAVAGLVLLVGLAVAFRRAWRRGGDDDRLLAVAAGCGCVGFLVSVLFSFTVAATGTLFVTCAGLLVRLGEPTPARQPGAGRLRVAPAVVRSRWPAYGAIAAGVLAAAWCGVIVPFRADACALSAIGLREDDPERALALNERAVALDPGRAELWKELAETARAAAGGHPDADTRRRCARRVAEAMGRAVELVPADGRLHARRGELLLELAGDGLAEPAAALAAFDAALARDPDNPCVLAGAARAAWASGRPDLARGHLLRGLAVDADQADLYATLGIVALAEGHVEEAEVHLAASVRHDWHGREDGWLHAATLWGYCLIRLNRFGGVEALLRGVSARRPDWPGPHLALGQVLALEGRPGAAEEFRRVIALAPGHPFADEARRWLGAK
jgi:tetratricopeptide (TPR) repeat protein